MYEHKPTADAIDYLVNNGHTISRTAAIEVSNSAANEVFLEFKRRVIDEYATKVITSLGASTRFTREEIDAENPITGEITKELKEALTTQTPEVPADDTVIDVEAVEEEEDSRKRARMNEPSSSSTATTFVPPLQNRQHLRLKQLLACSTTFFNLIYSTSCGGLPEPLP